MHKANRRDDPKGSPRKEPDDKDIGGHKDFGIQPPKRGRVIKYEGNTTTRRYPNTLQEAFPKDAEVAKWWFPPVPYWRSRDVVFAGIGIIAWIGLTYFFVRN